ncbi:MAG: redoxin domain-containing protein [Deltaproteobacteria bacterium]|nr:redoxin domain-containing protein [Deltaproteobacteria bacterium]
MFSLRFVLALPLLLAMGLGGAQAQLPTCKRLPSIQLKTPHGKSVRLNAVAGKSQAVVVVYGRADQPRTTRAVEDLQLLVKKYRAQAIVILVVVERHGGKKAALALGAKLPTSFKILLDHGDVLRAGCGLFVYPTTLVFDKKHKLHSAYMGHRGDYGEMLEDKFREVFGLPALAKVSKVRAPASKKRRISGMERMMRKRDLGRAERRFSMAQRLLGTDTLHLVMERYQGWAKLLPEPESDPLATAAIEIGEGKKKAAHAVVTLRSLAAKKDATAHLARLWLGRALLRAGDAAKAKVAFEGCVGQASLRGQCEFELAALLSAGDAKSAVSWCKKGYALAFSDQK